MLDNFDAKQSAELEKRVPGFTDSLSVTDRQQTAGGGLPLPPVDEMFALVPPERSIVIWKGFSLCSVNKPDNN